MTLKWNCPDDTLNLREADKLFGMTDGNGDALFIGHGTNHMMGLVNRITVTDDGLGPSGFYTRVIAWGEDGRALWEGPLHNLEGVQYA